MQSDCIKNSHVTMNSQSECFISAQHSYATLKFVNDINSNATAEKSFMQLVPDFHNGGPYTGASGIWSTASHST